MGSAKLDFQGETRRDLDGSYHLDWKKDVRIYPNMGKQVNDVKRSGSRVIFTVPGFNGRNNHSKSFYCSLRFTFIPSYQRASALRSRDHSQQQR